MEARQEAIKYRQGTYQSALNHIAAHIEDAVKRGEFEIENPLSDYLSRDETQAQPFTLAELNEIAIIMQNQGYNVSEHLARISWR